MKRYRPQMLLLLGAAITMGSIVWELARMHPQTSYIVAPWSMRGYESVHGSVAFTIGALIFLVGLVTTFEFSLEPLYSKLLAVLMAAGAVGIALIYGSDERTMGGGMVGWFVAIVGAYIVRKALAPLIPKLQSTVDAVVSIAIMVVGAVLINTLLVGSERTAEPWLWVAVAGVVLLGLAITGKHAALSANRMLIFSTVGGGVAIALSAAAIRMNLIQAQLEESGAEGLAGQYKDTQITSGYFLAVFGMLIAFVGAVSLWAKRRDIIINRERAERQRAAAEASAAEIQAALELAQQHQREARSAN